MCQILGYLLPYFFSEWLNDQLHDQIVIQLVRIFSSFTEPEYVKRALQGTSP
jgi:hypothetical protein